MIQKTVYLAEDNPYYNNPSGTNKELVKEYMLGMAQNIATVLGLEAKYTNPDPDNLYYVRIYITEVGSDYPLLILANWGNSSYYYKSFDLAIPTKYNKETGIADLNGINSSYNTYTSTYQHIYLDNSSARRPLITTFEFEDGTIIFRMQGTYNVEQTPVMNFILSTTKVNGKPYKAVFGFDNANVTMCPIPQEDILTYGISRIPANLVTGNLQRSPFNSVYKEVLCNVPMYTSDCLVPTNLKMFSNKMRRENFNKLEIAGEKYIVLYSQGSYAFNDGNYQTMIYKLDE